jgi:hypothetical protein
LHTAVYKSGFHGYPAIKLRMFSEHRAI